MSINGEGFRLVAALVAALAMFMVVAQAGIATAFAAGDDPAGAQYNPKFPDDDGSAVISSTATDGDSAGIIGSLPFTGQDILYLGLVAVVLIGAGAALHRFSRGRSNG